MIPPELVTSFIPTAAIIGILFAIFLWKRVAAIQLTGPQAVLRSQNGRECVSFALAVPAGL